MISDLPLREGTKRLIEVASLRESNGGALNMKEEDLVVWKEDVTSLDSTWQALSLRERHPPMREAERKKDGRNLYLKICSNY